MKELEEAYWGKKEGAQVAPIIRDKYKGYGKEETVTSPEKEKREVKKPAKTAGILKKSASPEFKPKFDHKTTYFDYEKYNRVYYES